MPFLKSINNTTVDVYPYNTRTDHPNTSFPSGSDYPGFSVYWVHPTAQNNPDPAEYNAVEIEPVFNPSSGRWEQAWDYVAKSDEEKRLAKYNPAQFLQQMFANAAFETWLSNFSTFKQAGFLDAATNAKVDNNWLVVQTFYDMMVTANAPTPSAVAEWQALADVSGIPLTF
jgi:hypothetical protein